MSPSKLPTEGSKYSDAILGIAVIGIILLLIIPLPPLTLDLLIALNLVMAVMTLLITLYAEEILHFSVFPSLLLFLTLYRLGLNVAATRLILTEGEGGSIIKSFGSFVAGGHPLVGLIIFILLIVINFTVITKGAGRIAEVSARFTLDALPGKQMAIDAELNAGLIDKKEARMRRDKVYAEADFHGAMDGAAKFVRGDAIASVLMAMINLFGGVIMGLAVKGISLSEAFQTYLTLSIGDALTAQMPALMLSVGAGILVSRASAKEKLSLALGKQLFHRPRVLMITAVVMLILGVLPGMPLLVLWVIGLVLGGYGYAMSKTADKTEELLPTPIEENDSLLQLEPLEVECGAAPAFLDSLRNEMSGLRRRLALELGFFLPLTKISSNSQLKADHYLFKIRGLEIACGTTASQEKPLEALLEQLAALMRHHAYEFLNRQVVQKMVEEVRPQASAAIDEMIPKKLSLGHLLKVLQNLVKEEIPIRDLASILEILADRVSPTSTPEMLTEYVRQGFTRTISRLYAEKNRQLHVITLDQRVEQMILECVQKGENGGKVLLRNATVKNISENLQSLLEKSALQGIKPLILTSSVARMYVKQIVESQLPHVPVVSMHELEKDLEICLVGTVPPEVLI